MPATAHQGDPQGPASPQRIPAPRNEGAQTSGVQAPDAPAPAGRRRRVRNRLVAAVAVVGLVVVAAGTPGVLATSADLTESQRLVTLAGVDRQAVTLAHSLADERDEVTAFVAAGREDQEGDGKNRQTISESLSARVDRQIDEISAAVPTDHADLRHSLASVPSVRRTALTGKGTAMEAHRAYTDVISALHALAGELADRTPPRAAEATRAPAALGLAVEQASASRGLLLAALAVPQPDSVVSYDPLTGLPVQTPGEDSGAEARTRSVLTAAAQQARVRELAALADFDQAAGKAARDKVDATVTGPEVKTAESYLARLTDQPRLSGTERGTDPAKLEAALTARIEQMRGAESSLATARTERFEQLRDEDLTTLEIRIALLGGLLIVAVGVLAAVSRTLTRPLAVLRIGAARLAEAPDPRTEEPVRFTGRNDEFAQVVRSLNTLHGKLHDIGARAERMESDRGELTASRAELEAELTAARAELQQRTDEIGVELQRLSHTVHHTFVNLALRTLGLVERQLGVIETLEEREQDPERLATLFKLDHMATVMRRHSENLLVLAGAEHGHGHVAPVPLVDVLRASVSEIERYERVVIQSLPPHAQVAGFAADDLSHLVAELLENATSFSPPDAQVELSGWLLESGEVMLSVQDAGIGMTAARIAEVNARLENPEASEGETPAGREGEGLGLRVAGLLAARHGVRIQLREHKQGGITAVVVIPDGLLPTGPPAAAERRTPVAGAAPALNLPGSVAEANSNALPISPRRTADADAAPEPATDAAASGAPQPAQSEAHASEPAMDAAPSGAPLPAQNEAPASEPARDAAPSGAPQSAQDEAHAPKPVDAAATGAPEPAADAAPEQQDAPSTAAPGQPAADGAAGREAQADAFPASGEPAQSDAPAEETSPLGGARGPVAAPDSRTDVSGEPHLAGTPAIHAGHPDDAEAPGQDGGGHPEPEPDPFVLAAERAIRSAAPETHERTPDDGPVTTGIDQETFAMRLPQLPADHTPDEQPPHPSPDAEDEQPPTPSTDAGGGQPSHASPEAPAAFERVTDKGLPKRTPKSVQPATAPTERTGSVDAEALRRRLGGFHQGAKDGRRDAEAEIVGNPGQKDQRNTQAETGDTVEEARS